MIKVASGLLILLILLPLCFSGFQEDTFCIGTAKTNLIDDDNSTGHNHTCSLFGGYMGLADAYEINLSDGSSEINISIAQSSENSTMLIRLPLDINITTFEINMTGLVLDINEPRPVGAVVSTDVSGSMYFDCYDGSPGDPWSSGGSTANPCGDCNPATCVGPGCACGCKMCDAKDADKLFTFTVLNGSEHSDTRLGLVSYGYWSGSPRRAHAEVTHCMSDDNISLSSSVDSYTAYGDTPISAGLNVSMALLDDYTLSDNKVILLMTDGQARDVLGTCWSTGLCGGIDDYCDAPPDTAAAILEAISKSGEVGAANISLYVIGFGSGADVGTLTAMAAAVNASGTDARGYYFFAPDAAELSQIYEMIARNIAFNTPEDVYIDVGGNGTQEWIKSGELGFGNVVNIAPWLMYHLQTSPVCSCAACTNVTDPITEEKFCEINISIGSSSGGEIEITDINSFGAYRSGHISSYEYIPGTATEPLKGWGRFCFDNLHDSGTSDTNSTFYVLNGSGFLINSTECPDCSDFFSGVSEVQCVDMTDVNVVDVPSVVLYGEMFTDVYGETPRIDLWNISFFASEPLADAGGTYSCFSGQVISLDATGSCQNLTSCECVPMHSCSEAALGTIFEFYWTVRGPAAFGVWHSAEITPDFPCGAPGSYAVDLVVTNRTSRISDNDPTVIVVDLPPAQLVVEEIELVQPIVRGITSESFVLVSNRGGQGEGYEIIFRVFNSSGDLVFDNSSDEAVLPGSTMRYKGFSWVPPDSGQYTTNASIYSLADGSMLYNLTRTSFVIEVDTEYTGSEYPLTMLLLMIVILPGLAFFVSKRF
ncbi:VWA domain-containing protein [archaeon]|nr:VWA domain-containing protein [archaeon]